MSKQIQRIITIDLIDNTETLEEIPICSICKMDALRKVGAYICYDNYICYDCLYTYWRR